MPDPPLVSVVIPAFNAERYLGEALRSVLDQTRPADEILVVDDGSDDGTVAVAEGFAGVRVLPGEHRGPGPTRNRGIAAARGVYVAFLDADDLWLPDKLEQQVAVLDTEDEIDLVFGAMDQFHSAELSAEERQRLECKTESTPTPLMSCLLARRSVFDRVGPLDDHLADFVAWLSRAKNLGVKARFVDALVARRRIHGANLSAVRRAEVQRDYLRAARASLQHRRAVLGGGSS